MIRAESADAPMFVYAETVTVADGALRKPAIPAGFLLPRRSPQRRAWRCRPSATNRGVQQRVCCTKWCGISSRPSACRPRACATARGCRGSSRRSFAPFSGAAGWPAGSRASAVRHAAWIGSLRRVVDHCVRHRLLKSVELIDPPRNCRAACFMSLRDGSAGMTAPFVRASRERKIRATVHDQGLTEKSPSVTVWESKPRLR